MILHQLATIMGQKTVFFVDFSVLCPLSPGHKNHASNVNAFDNLGTRFY